MFLVVASTAEELRAFAVDSASPGVMVTALPTLYRTLRLARVEFSATNSALIKATSPVGEAAERAFDMGIVARADAQLFGDPDFNRENFLQVLEGV